MAIHESWLKIGENTYPVSDARMFCSVADGGLCMELYSFDQVSAEYFDTHGGMTINGVTWPSVASPGDLVGQTLIVTRDDEDAELAESVFWEKGKNLDIERLSLSCESLVDECIVVRVTATLLDTATKPYQTVSAEGRLTANVRIE